MPDRHVGGRCAKLTTHLIKCKALGIVNITVLAAGSLFLGQLMEPVTSSKNPMTKMNAGIYLTGAPKAVRFDYRIHLSGARNRVKETGFGRGRTISGKDDCEALNDGRIRKVTSTLSVSGLCGIGLAVILVGLMVLLSLSIMVTFLIQAITEAICSCRTTEVLDSTMPETAEVRWCR